MKTNPTPEPSPCSVLDVLCSARAKKTIAAACINPGSQNRKIYSTTVPTKEMEKVEIEMLAWRDMAQKLQAALRLHAYTGYKQVADVLRDFDALNVQGDSTAEAP